MTTLEDEKLGLFTDLYQLAMLDAYLADDMHEQAVFTLFVRRLPESRSFLMAAGLEPLLQTIEHLSFEQQHIDYLKQQGFSDRLLDFLTHFKFTGQVRALPEGTIFFENEPIVEIKAPLPQAQLLETLVMNQLHLQTVLASKAARVVMAAREKPVLDFGARRVHGIDAGIKGSRAMYIAGVAATSNMLAGYRYQLPVAGTMAHSYIQAHDTEYQAFSHFIEQFPETVLLIDTIDTLQGAENVIQLAKKLQNKFHVKGVRLDSGDLGQLAKDVRQRLDDNGLEQLKIYASGGLDEHEIAELLADGAPIDGFGVGTGMGVSSDVPALDMAYKLVHYDDHGRLKLSSGKAVLPGEKQVFREANKRLVKDTIGRINEKLPGQPLLKIVMQDGKRLPSHQHDITKIRAYAKSQLTHLPNDGKSFDDSFNYPVHVSKELKNYQKHIAEWMKQGDTE